MSTSGVSFVGDAPALDADPGPDPLVAGVDPRGELVVGDDPVGLHAAQAEQPGAGDGLGQPQAGVIAMLPAALCSATRAAAASRSSGVFRAERRHALAARAWPARPACRPAAARSAPSPRARAASPGRQSQRTGRVTWATSRRSASAPPVTAAPSALDSSVQVGSAGGDAERRARRSAVSAGAMNRVWNAPATASGTTRARSGGSSASAASASTRPGGDDLAGAVAVGGSSPSSSRRASTSSGFPPSTALMPVGSSAHAAAISRPAHRGERDGRVRREHAGHGGGGELADRVPGGDEASSRAASTRVRQPPGQSGVGEQRGGHHQGLGDRGVADLLGVRGGAQPLQVQARRRRTSARRASRPRASTSHGASMPGVCAPCPGASRAITPASFTGATARWHVATRQTQLRPFGGSSKPAGGRRRSAVRRTKASRGSVGEWPVTSPTRRRRYRTVFGCT